MKTYAICPVSDKKVNENIVRSNAILNVLILSAFLITQNIIIIAILFLDFILRGAELNLYSPLSIISKWINKILKIRIKYTNAGPKLFAARIGIFFNFGIIIFSILNLPVTALILAGIFLVCAFLEGVFGFCVACQIYPFYYKLINFRKSELV